MLVQNAIKVRIQTYRVVDRLTVAPHVAHVLVLYHISDPGIGQIIIVEGITLSIYNIGENAIADIIDVNASSVRWN